MNRNSFSWAASFAVHAALLGWLSIVAMTLPMTTSFERGRASIELQATIAAAPREESATRPIKIEPLRPVAKSKPPILEPIDTPLDRQPPELPKPMKLAAETPIPVEVAVATPVRNRMTPKEEVVEVEIIPPPRRFTEKKPAVVEAPMESVATAASEAEAGVDIEELPQPHPLNRQPPYPTDAYVRRQQGTVVLHLQVTTGGTVGDVRIVQSSGYSSLDQAAVEAARGWRYTPARRGGMNIAMVFETRVNFSIRG